MSDKLTRQIEDVVQSDPTKTFDIEREACSGDPSGGIGGEVICLR